MTSQAPAEPHARSVRRLKYSLKLEGTVEEIKASLAQWKFVGTSATQPFASVSQGVIGIGTNDQTTFNFLDIDELANCSVECLLRIVDDGGELSRWAGIRLRGFLFDIRFGYLVYLRATGSVELYRAETVLAGANEFVVRDPKADWTKLRIDLFGSDIRVWVNDTLHITASDPKFSDKGLIYFHTFGTHAQLKAFDVYEIVEPSF